MVNEEIVFDYEVTGSAVSSIDTGAILNGDVDGWYTIIVFSVQNATAEIGVRYNNDSGANYGRRRVYGQSTGVGDSANTAATYDYLCGVTSGQRGFSVSKLYAKTGAVRLRNNTNIEDVSGTTVTTLFSGGYVWNDTSTNITSMTFMCSAGTALGVGTRVIILRPVTNTGAKTWVEVGSSVLGAAASSVTFSGLDGDVDQVYMYDVQFKGTGGVTQGFIKPNNLGTGIYGLQALRAVNTTVSAERRAGDSTGYIDSNSVTASGSYASFQGIMYAKTGFIRPWLVNFITSISGTTVTSAGVSGGVLNDTSTNITSLVLGTTANNWDIGTQVKLYALRP